jgi:hypothetical protein
MSSDPDLLITRYLDGVATAEEVGELNEAIRADPGFRERFVAQAALIGLLSEGLRGGAVTAPRARIRPPPRRRGDRPRSATRPWQGRIGLGIGVMTIAAIVGFWATRPSPVTAAPAVAQIVAWKGAAAVRRAGAEQALSMDMAVVSGDRLDTGADGGIELAWPDGSHTTFAATSRGSIAAPAGVPLLMLEHGTVEVAVDQHLTAPPLAIMAGDWRIEHLGTLFTVSIDGGARVQVREGRVAVHAPGTPPLTVYAGQVAAQEPGGRPALRWDLPAVAYGTVAQPFAANSLWNTPIPPGTELSPFPTAALTSMPWVTTATRVLVIPGSEPRIEVTRDGPGEPLGRIPGIPADMDAKRFITDFVVVLDPDGRRVWELYATKRLEQRLTAQRVMAVDLGGPGVAGIIPGAGYPAYAGLVQGDELRTGIYHAIAIYLTQPMLTATGLRPGNRVALPEDFIVPAAAGGPATEPELVAALRRHGAIIVGPASKPHVGVDSRLPAAVHARVAAAFQSLAPYLQRVR